MKGVVGIISVALILIAGVFHVWAWEFKLEEFDVSAQYLRLYQTGSKGFFGPYDVDRSVNTYPSFPFPPYSGGNCAPRNFWNGFTTATGSSSAAAFGIAAARPELKINRAISLKSDVWLGPQIPGVLPNSGAPFGITFWGAGWAEIDMPVGRLYLGKRPFGKGCGFQFAGTSLSVDTLWFGRAEDFLELEVPYGPLKFNLGFYPWSLPDLIGNMNTTARRTQDFGYYAWNPPDQTQSGYYYPDPTDTNAQNTQNWFVGLTYLSGNIELGAGNIFRAHHAGAESQTTTYDRINFASFDRITKEGWAYLKYFNGRVFFNAEADWYLQETRFQAPLFYSINRIPPYHYDGSDRYRYAPLYVEALRYMTEFGAVTGPVKTSFLYTKIPGPDRRHGILINNQSLVQGPAQTAARVFQPYATIMPYAYRSGNNSYLDMTDAECLGVRVDYALAANMDLSASWFRARRLSKGYGVAYWTLDPGGDITPQAQIKGSFSNPTPAIADDELGTEWTISLRWKLLENFMVKTTWAHFTPGKWWKYACIDKSIPGWDVQAGVAGWNRFGPPPPPASAPWGINPDRTIDPVGMFRMEAWIYY